MCDTMSIVSGWSEDGLTYFAKNSDRSPNEPLLTLRIPAKNHKSNSMVQCTYISIPQVENTREMIIYKPSWIWGAEMGINDARVAIGNEAVFTKSKRGEPALTGMDILRLALERADSAALAIEIMIKLLETYGQGGNCGFDKKFYYDNSFLAADPKESYVLETSGKNYAVIKVEDRYAISNRLTIGKNYIKKAGVRQGEDFAKLYTEPVYSHFAQAKKRRSQAMDQLMPTSSAKELMDILRTHDNNFDGYEFKKGSVGSLCMHAGGLVGDHATGSVVAVLRPDKPITLWSTGCSTPCIAAFKPVFWNSNSPPLFIDPSDALDYWLKREHIHRAIIAGKIDEKMFRERIKELETLWLKREESIINTQNPDKNELASLAYDADKQEQALINELYTDSWRDITDKNRYARYWKKKNDKLMVRNK